MIYKKITGSILLPLFLIISQISFAQNGTIRGKVSSGSTGDALQGATIRVLSNGQMRGGAYTDLEGAFNMKVPVGTYDLIISFISYINDTIPGIVVAAGETSVHESLLFDENSVREDLAVTITAKRDEASDIAFQVKKQNAINAMDGVTFDLISRTGDNNVALAMQRVVGVTVTDGKYVYVRGLGDRYSKTLLNNSEIPGLDPERNTVQMDIFPSNLIDNIEVVKNFTPDLPGDFSGGLINITTKDFPDRFQLNFSTSMGYNPQANLRDDFLGGKSGSRDWLAMDDGTRAEPELLVNLRESGQSIPSRPFLTDPEQAQLVEDASNSFVTPIVPTLRSSGLNQSYQFSIGNQFTVGKGFLGVIGGISYRNSFSYTDNLIENRFSLPDQGASGLSYRNLLDEDGRRGAHNVLWGAMGKVSYKTANHKISFNYMRNQSLNDKATYLEGLSIDIPSQIPSDRTENIEELEYYQTSAVQSTIREINIFQLSGKSTLSKLANTSIEWNGSYVPSKLDEPDFGFFTNGYVFPSGTTTDTTWTLAQSTHQLPSRYFREMDETLYNGKVDITVPFKQWNGLKAEIKFGGSYSQKDRRYEETRYNFRNGEPFTGNYFTYFTEDNLGISDTVGTRFDTGLSIQDRTLGQNSYTGEQTIQAGYLMTVLPIVEQLKFIGGVRYEGTFAKIVSDDTTNFPAANLDLDDFLPSLSLIYHPTEKMNVRAAAYRTLARPSFREFSPLITFDFNGDWQEWGNVNLNRTLITSADVRWEWFFGIGELVSVSVFGKQFDQPIQKVVQNASQTPFFKYDNVEDATAYGLEFEVKKNFGFLAEGLEKLQISANAALIQSRVDIQDAEYQAIIAVDPNREQFRPLFAQSPYTANGELAYIDKASGLSASVSYNVFGERLVLVGASGTPDVYEQPRQLVNVSLSKSFGKYISVKLRANNLLNPEYKFTQTYGGVSRVGEETISLPDKAYTFRSYTIGRSFSLGVSFKLSE